MTTNETFIKRYAVLIYFILTFAITWGGMALVIGPGNFPMTAEQFETVGPLMYVGCWLAPA